LRSPAVAAATIACDDDDVLVKGKPGFRCRLLAIRQKHDWLASLQIAHDRVHTIVP
jgi:hypothetical protein